MTVARRRSGSTDAVLGGAPQRRARMLVLALALCGLLGYLSSAPAWAGARSHARAVVRSAGVTAWLPYWEMPAALSSTLDNASAIATASPYWYDIGGDSTVHDEAGAGSPSVIAQLHARGIRLVPMVTEQAGMPAFARILESASRRATLVRTLVALGSQQGYAGLDLDFESFAYDSGHRTAPANRIAALYPTLVGQVCAALHAIARSCQVAVMARTSAATVYAHRDIATWVYDYRALASVADRVQIMAYDDHSPGGRAGPIAPLPWVRQVIAYARSQAAGARYELGLAAYGYDWWGRTSGTAVLARQAPALVAQTHARPRWDPVQGEETFSFRLAGRRHIVWYENAAADLERARLAAAAGFSGTAVWAAGYEQPQLWRQLQSAAARA